ncbi:MAG: radical SAM protein [Desulfobacterales bacterium]|nr:radical SAM protein [Desulfobacterales bacterium]
MGLSICEIFHSLQGESTHAGRPCIFVRLSQCNLNCCWCDTQYARTDEEGMFMELDTILEKVAAFDCNLVEITGGEPLLQDQTPELISRLLQAGYEVLLETNGSQDIQPVDPACTRILDIKCPGSGEGDSFLWSNLDILGPGDEIKFVVGSREDYEFARTVITRKLDRISGKKIHLSPVFGNITPQTLAQWIIQDNLKARLSLQQHKLIWHPDQRGV